MTTPRYLRFAQALALCTGLATVPACPSSTTSNPDTGPGPMDAPIVPTDVTGGTDAPPDLRDASGGTDAPATGEDAPSTGEDAPVVGVDAPIALEDSGVDHCSLCRCDFPTPIDGGEDPRPNCFDVPGSEICCAVIGPLSPPDLPA